MRAVFPPPSALWSSLILYPSSLLVMPLRIRHRPCDAFTAHSEPGPFLFSRRKLSNVSPDFLCVPRFPVPRFPPCPVPGICFWWVIWATRPPAWARVVA